MTYYNGIFGDIIRNALVRSPLLSRFVSGHTDAVRYDVGEYFVVLYFGKLEFLKP